LLLLFSSGESMENALRACCKGIKIGKILIHREGDNGQKVWFNPLFLHVLGWVKSLSSTFLLQLIYQNLPKDIANRHVLLLDPILGTGSLMNPMIPTYLCKTHYFLVNKLIKSQISSLRFTWVTSFVSHK
jgi:uracil phosphoribosyltransferase